MKYKYLYQDRQNRNCEGWIKAKNRENAYTLLRKQGIKPYRIIGDDPVNWLPWAIGGVVAALLAAIVALGILMARKGVETAAMPRHQLAAPIDFEALPTALDKYLAWFAQPGRWVERPEAVEEEMELFARDLETEIAVAGEQAELMRILKGMRDEMAAALKAGKTVKEYCDFLEERQEQEETLRLKAQASVDKAPESYRELVWRGVNAKLKEMGIKELDKPQGLEQNGNF